jgi:hypothetical protein
VSTLSSFTFVTDDVHVQHRLFLFPSSNSIKVNQSMSSSVLLTSYRERHSRSLLHLIERLSFLGHKSDVSLSQCGHGMDNNKADSINKLATSNSLSNECRKYRLNETTTRVAVGVQMKQVRRTFSYWIRTSFANKAPHKTCRYLNPIGINLQ